MTFVTSIILMKDENFFLKKQKIRSVTIAAKHNVQINQAATSKHFFIIPLLLL